MSQAPPRGLPEARAAGEGKVSVGNRNPLTIRLSFLPPTHPTGKTKILTKVQDRGKGPYMASASHRLLCTLALGEKQPLRPQPESQLGEVGDPLRESVELSV